MRPRVRARLWSSAVLAAVVSAAVPLAVGPGLVAHPAAGVEPVATAHAGARPAPSTSEPVSDLIVRYRSADQRTAARVLEAAGTTVGGRLRLGRSVSGGLRVVNLSRPVSGTAAAAIARSLAADASVEFAEPDLRMRAAGVSAGPVAVRPNDPYLAQQWNLAGPYGIRAPRAWGRATGSSVVVAVVDTGLTAHPEMQGRTVPGYDMITDSTVARDGGGRDANPADPGDAAGGATSSWHGTHVAGIVAASWNNGRGISGVAPQARIQAVRVLGAGGGMTSDIVDGIAWAAGRPVAGVPANATPARVINLSLAANYASCPESLQSAIDAATDAGATVVVAAGNDGWDARHVAPANCERVITVAASGPTGRPSSYSNFGPAIDLAAPGGDTTFPSGGILSLVDTGASAPVAPSYARYQGTSMAAPHVAGIAALLTSHRSAITPQQVEQSLKASAWRLPECPPNACGAGLLDAARALPGRVGTAVADATGDGRGDLVVHRPATGTWYVRGGQSRHYGEAGDVPLRGDYDGDGANSPAVYRPSTGVWYVTGMTSVKYGEPGDIPLQGDFTGDGRSDIAVFRPATGTWYVRGVGAFVFGQRGDVPVTTDTDGDGRTDVAVFRASTGMWYLRGSLGFRYGEPGDVPVAPDVDGDGRSEISVFRPSTGAWYVRGGSSVLFGRPGDVPVPRDLDGDGDSEIAVYRPATGVWHVRGVGSFTYGIPGDRPV